MDQPVTYERLLETAEKNGSYLNGSLEQSAEQTAVMAWEVLSILKNNIPGVVGGFGLGFPFHSVDSSYTTVPNPEFQDYSDRFINAVQRDRALAQTAIWECSPCQRRDGFSPSDCGDCSLVTLKPRQVMKFMPDIDLFVVAEDIAAPTLAHVQDVASAHRFNQSDFDATDALDRIDEVFEAFERGTQPERFLPADVHLIQESTFLDTLRQIENGEVDVSLPIRSMYAGWKPNKKIDLWFDFTFSATFNDLLCSEAINEAVRSARRGLAMARDNDTIEQLVRQKSKRADVLLNHPPTNALLHTRLNEWRAL